MLDFPFETVPAPGDIIEIRPGILWARLSLPFRLDHVNIYFIADDDGWIIVDTGVDDETCRSEWLALLAGPLAGFRFKGLLVTHHHADHIGLAGWLCDLLDIPLLTSRTTFLSAMIFYNSPTIQTAPPYSHFLVSHGMPPECAAIIAMQGQEYMQMLSKPPLVYRRIKDGDVLTFGGRRFQVMSGDGHCPEQLMLHLAEEGLFLAADQVIEKISPNVSVMAFEPDGDPLGGFLHSLARIREEVADDALVLTGHRLPFRGLHDRCDALIAHHEERCDIIRSAVCDAPKSAVELMSLMFRSDLSQHEMSFAFTEVLAHTNYLVARGDCFWHVRRDNIWVIRTMP